MKSLERKGLGWAGLGWTGEYEHDLAGELLW